MGRDRLRMNEQDSQAKRQDNSAQNETANNDKLETRIGDGLNSRQNAVLRMQTTQGNAAVRRMLVQRQAGTDLMEGGPLDDNISHEINSARSGGQNLDSGVAEKMGSAMGADFSGVKVHTDAKSDNLNRSVAAKAFTTGNDIFFSQGTYQPQSGEGQKLLAHELTHVVQQGSSAPSGPLTLGPASDSYESEADAVSSTVARMTDMSAVQRHTDDEGAEGAIQREADEDMDDEMESEE